MKAIDIETNKALVEQIKAARVSVCMSATEMKEWLAGRRPK